MFRTSIIAIRPSIARRALHVSPASFKTVKETVSEVADSVNKKVGKGLASALETGQNAAETTKEKLGTASEEAKYKTNETSAQAGHKLNQAASGAKQAKEDFKKEVKK